MALDKDKYVLIMKNESLHAAITKLHVDMLDLEEECMESKSGFNPDIYEELREWRNFSRELWDLKHHPKVKLS
jgi:hypothetical protein